MLIEQIKKSIKKIDTIFNYLILLEKNSNNIK